MIYFSKLTNFLVELFTHPRFWVYMFIFITLDMYTRLIGINSLFITITEVFIAIYLSSSLVYHKDIERAAKAMAKDIVDEAAGDR